MNTAGLHYVEYFEIDEENGGLVSKEVFHEIYDENGTATYTKVIEGTEEASTEDEITEAYEKFRNATVISFGKVAKE